MKAFLVLILSATVLVQAPRANAGGIYEAEGASSLFVKVTNKNGIVKFQLCDVIDENRCRGIGDSQGYRASDLNKMRKKVKGRTAALMGVEAALVVAAVVTVGWALSGLSGPAVAISAGNAATWGNLTPMAPIANASFLQVISTAIFAPLAGVATWGISEAVLKPVGKYHAVSTVNSEIIEGEAQITVTSIPEYLLALKYALSRVKGVSSSGKIAITVN
jgi:hypothetical protein